MSDLKEATQRTSLIALVLCYGIMAYTAFIYHPKWQDHQTEATISWDVSGYYMYLPATFIYHDLKECKFKEHLLEKYRPTPDFQQAFVHKASGHYVMKYSLGQSVVMAPFFFIGHTWASNSAAYLADGFSFPYQISIGIGMFFIALIGLFFLRKILRYYFKESTVAIVLLLYVAGTNYLNYSSVDQAMTHNTLFTIYALLVWTSIKFYKNNRTRYLFFIGLLTGLATLIRPTEIISLLIPLLWEVSNFDDLKQRFSFIRKNISKLVWVGLPFSLLVFLQPLYWYYATGEWVVYSYQDQGFSWLHPHIWDYCMSYSCGWLRYCPMMFFPLIGLFFYLKKQKHRFTILLYTFATLYITTAWDVWTYGGTAGRAMVQHYVILAFPFATLIEAVNKHHIIKFIFYPFALLFAYLNIWAIRAGDGNIQISGNTRQYYWAVVGRWTAEQHTKKLLDNRHLFNGAPEHPVIIYQNSLRTDSTEHIHINKENQYSPRYLFPKPKTSYKWIRVFTEFTCTTKEYNIWNQSQFILTFYNRGEEVQVNLIRVHRFIENHETKEIYLDAKAPKDWDQASVLYWNADGAQELKMRNLKVIGFNS